MRLELDLSPLQITLAYVVFAMVALFISDVLFVRRISDPVLRSQLQTIKAGLEIILTAGLIYVLTRASQQSLSRSNTQLQRRTQELDILQRLFRHNIRNDINVVRGRAEWLLAEEFEAETAQQLDTIVSASNRIVAYVEKSKRISDLGEGETPVESRDIITIIDTSIDQVTDYATGIDITQDTPPSAYADAHRLLEVGVFEVMDNAVSHNESETPKLTITVEDSTEWVTLHIADNGPGIPEHERTVLREGDETPLVHSSGVGLWLAYWATTRSGGEFEISDNDPSGSVVTMKLPHSS